MAPSDPLPTLAEAKEAFALATSEFKKMSAQTRELIRKSEETLAKADRVLAGENLEKQLARQRT